MMRLSSLPSLLLLLLAIAVRAAVADAPPKITSEALHALDAAKITYIEQSSDRFGPALGDSFNKAYADVKPALIVLAADEEEVVESLRWAKRYKQAVTVRASGSGPAGWSVREHAVLVDISQLNSVEHQNNTDGGSTYTVGGATPCEKVRLALVQHNDAFPLPAEGSISVGGYILGGGQGLGARWLGLAAHWVRGMRVALPNGTDIVDATRTNEHSGLFYEALGAGGGNFGVVTQFTIRLTERNLDGTWWDAELRAPASGHSYADMYASAAAAAPPAVHTVLRYDGDSGKYRLMGFYAGANSTVGAAFFSGGLYARADGAPTTVQCSYTDAVTKFQGPGSGLPAFYQGASGYLTQTGSAADAVRAVEGVFRASGRPAGASFELNALGSEAVNATLGSYPWGARPAMLSWQVLGGGHKAADRKSVAKWVDKVSKAARATGALDGAYVEHPDPTPPSGDLGYRLYHGRFSVRLREAKHEYDPEYLMGYPGSVPPCDGCMVYGYVPPPTTEADNYVSLYVIIFLAVAATAYLLYIVFRKDKAVVAANQPLLEADI